MLNGFCQLEFTTAVLPKRKPFGLKEVDSQFLLFKNNWNQSVLQLDAWREVVL